MRSLLYVLTLTICCSLGAPMLAHGAAEQLDPVAEGTAKPKGKKKRSRKKLSKKKRAKKKRAKKRTKMKREKKRAKRS